MVEEGNFRSRERLLSWARSGGIIASFESLYLGLDWARVSDETIATVGNDQNDVLDWFRYPKMRYEEQTELLLADLKRKRRTQLPDGQIVEGRVRLLQPNCRREGRFEGTWRFFQWIPAEQQRASHRPGKPGEVHGPVQERDVDEERGCVIPRSWRPNAVQLPS